jgi:hypothetical protein
MAAMLGTVFRDERFKHPSCGWRRSRNNGAA